MYNKMKKLFITICITTLLFSCGNSNSKTQEKLGLTEKERKEIFINLQSIEVKARQDANKAFPVDISKPDYKEENIEKNVEINSKLIEQYQAEVRKEFKISEDTQWEIISEGVKKGWNK